MSTLRVTAAVAAMITVLSPIDCDAQTLPEIVPDCAVYYLYSVGDVHYYETVSCMNPLIFGYGTTGGLEPIEPLGCNGPECSVGSIVDPEFAPDLAGNSVVAKLVGALLSQSDNCKCRGKGRFRVPKGMGPKRDRALRKVLRRLSVIAISGPRATVAGRLKTKLEDGDFLAALAGNRGALRQRQAEFEVERFDAFLETAIVAGGKDENPGTGPKFYSANRDYGIGTLENLINPTTQIAVGDLVRNNAITGTKTKGFGADDAALKQYGDAASGHNYAEVRIGDTIAIFRLFDVEFERKKDGNGPADPHSYQHYVGQQVLRSEIPTGVTLLPMMTGEGHNIIVEDNLEHVHVLRLRTSEGDGGGDPGELNDMNSRRYIVYSDRDLSSVP